MTRARATKERLREAALKLFRAKGFEKTTMRAVAEEAGMSLGAVYYYFPSKEAIVLAYYEDNLAHHRARAREVFASTDDVGARLAAAFDTKLELVRGDRGLLGALFHTLGDPRSTASLFSRETAVTRAASIAIYAEALAPAGLPDDVRDTAALALWGAHLGLVLYFLHDRSKGAARTKALAGDVVALLAPLVPLLHHPAAGDLTARLGALLAHAGLAAERR